MILNRSQCRQVDRLAVDEYAMTGLVLMENAGRGLADTLCGLGIDGPVVICCGRGNNGGDGFVLARHLDVRGFRVKVLLWAEPDELTGDAAANYEIIRRAGIACHTLGSNAETPRLEREAKDAAWAVDALLGTGGRGNPRPPLDAVIETLNSLDVPILAVDVPSGLDCDTGEAGWPTIRAAHTCTFVAAKPGFLVDDAQRYTGTLHVLDIGVPRKLLERIAGKP